MLSGNMAARLWSGVSAGGFIFAVLVLCVLLPAGVIALTDRAERRAIERLRREGMRCTALVKSFRRISMTQHRVLFELLLPTGRLGREYVLTGLNDTDLANWTALQVPLAASADPNASTIALDALPYTAPSKRWVFQLVGVALVAGIGVGVAVALLHRDDEAALSSELRAVCTALRRQGVDVAKVDLNHRRGQGVVERAWLDLDGEPYDLLRRAAPAATAEEPQCLAQGLVVLCARTRLDDRRSPADVRPSPRVKEAFAASTSR
ncbi:hypothetical protein [Chondromyces crocatus]|uniref:Uncharacterized protein n=1 Tax=Chondromyces crocatus TaxID=52 RepID=A0A0K1EK93_CHOCO|nr:hypothetical protein [Chondromyces crocatus]AKT41284.1 uncharacterized protein CMC5_054510 [Chondromyces crocatus]